MESTPTPPSYPLPGGLRFLGAVFSFLIPGLGQMLQGIARRDSNRLAKGMLFFVCLLGMFYYGMWLANWKNVYLPPFTKMAPHKPVVIFSKRLDGLGGDLYTRPQYVGQFWIGLSAWPALWHYYHPESEWLGDYQRVPRRGQSLEQAEAEMNVIQLDANMGKRWDIAWIYTVIAGVLNILVIYDAAAGPVHRKMIQSEGLRPPLALGGNA